MNYGFVIDNTSCIGCHACSTACKSENEVSLGVYRTWVKYTETGTYPDTRRHFQVTRCNHCANPPCVRICPTQAMYQRADGIVEFDSEACIGCKACMQACPYDAIHIDPETNTAAKCHYCSHRTDIGLEPACVVVCPTHAILAGDLDDPESEIAQKVAREKVTVRKPEQGTAPKLFYIEGAEVNLHPTATERSPETYMWADSMPLHGQGHVTPGRGDAAHGHGSNGHPSGNGDGRTTDRGVSLRAPQDQGSPANGPIQIAPGRMADHMVQVAYNAQHKVPWHWPVPAYLVTKGIGTGAFMLTALAFLFGLPFHAPTAIAAGLIATVMMLATTALLVYDLEKPERFLYILLRPQWRSWLARGSILLIGFSTIAGLWPALEIGAVMGLLPEGLAEGARPFLMGLGVPFAFGAAIYTAFLFGQAEGRDLWQSPLLPLHLVVQAAFAGAGAMYAAGWAASADEAFMNLAAWTFAGALVVDLFVTLLGEFGMPHASEIAARAAHEISHGRYAKQFWGGAIALGHIVPLALLATGAPALGALAAACAFVGLYAYEHAYVMAPQEIPNS